ncbi:PhzF family phenazine biosynthesis protein [Methanoculleus sp. FWC-SCC1]|uniref:PhzF family phenazine biosynthesis protein n=1 Tax=Methanoculleus frigidifontis TaxID=2584085 RepID=A0ABT8M6R8_9EURY|nr:hypothetical protein [Methanoculleus sp. FWC-SCC1]MDN7023627.1 PhzF family phenazine biosynthesis protein [Methanoculleus sp. FWC-SCC1]
MDLESSRAAGAGLRRTAAALGLGAENLDPATPLAVVNAGLDTLLVPLVSLDACIGCAPDYATLRAFALAHAVDVIVIYTRGTAYPEHEPDLHPLLPRRPGDLQPGGDRQHYRAQPHLHRPGGGELLRPRHGSGYRIHGRNNPRRSCGSGVLLPVRDRGRLPV